MSKLIKCKSCDKEISKTAKSCPHCGEHLKDSLLTQILKLIIMLIVLWVGFELTIRVMAVNEVKKIEKKEHNKDFLNGTGEYKYGSYK